MGFSDRKTRVIDVVLTPRGKEQLSKEKLNIKYYAFSDDGVDYRFVQSGSFPMSGSNAISTSKIYTRNMEPTSEMGDLSIKHLIFDSNSDTKPTIKPNKENLTIEQRSKRIKLIDLNNILDRAGDININYVGVELLDEGES